MDSIHCLLSVYVIIFVETTYFATSVLMASTSIGPVAQFCELFNGIYMGGKLHPYEFWLPLMRFPSAILVIHFCLFGIWKFKLETRYIAVKLVTSFGYESLFLDNDECTSI